MSEIDTGGMGFNFKFTGMDELNKAVEQVHKLKAEFKDGNNSVRSHFKMSFEGLDTLHEVHKLASELNRNIDTHFNLHMDGQNTLNQFRQEASKFTNDLNQHLRQTSEDAGLVAENFRKIAGSIRPSVEPSDRLHEALRKNTMAVTEFKDKSIEALRSIDGHMDHLRGKTKEESHGFGHLHGLIAGTFLGGYIAAGATNVVGAFKSMMMAGQRYNTEQDRMRTVWKALTTHAPQDGKTMVNYINYMASRSIYAAGTLDKMAQGFYHVHSNVKETETWTNDFIRLGSTLHMTNGQLTEAGSAFTKIMAGGKGTAADMHMMLIRFPMFGEALQKVTGKSLEQLRELSRRGQLSSKVFEEALDSLGKKYKSGTEDAMHSMTGMTMYIKQRYSTLAGYVEKSSFNMSKSGAKSIQSLLSDKMMKQYANGISKAISGVTGYVVKLLNYVNHNKGAIMSIFGSLVKIGKIFGAQVFHSIFGTLKNIAEAFGLIHKNSKASQSPINSVAEALKNLSKNKPLIQDLGKAFAFAFAYKKIAPFRWGVKGLTASFRGLFSFSKSWRKLGSFTDALKISKLGKGVGAVRDFASATKSVFSIIKSSAVTGATKIVSLVKSINFARIATKAWSGVTKVATGIQAAFDVAMDANPVGLIITGIVAGVAAIGVGLYELYKHFKPFRKFINGLGRGIQKFFGSAVHNAKKWTHEFASWIGNGLSSTKHNIGKWSHEAGSNINRWRSSASYNAHKWSHEFVDFIGGKFNEMRKSNPKLFKNMWGLVSSIQKAGAKYNRDQMQIFKDVFTGHWRNLKKDVPKLFGDMWSSLKDMGKAAFKWLNGLSGGRLKDIVDKFSDAKKAIHNVWSDTWQDVKNVFKGAWNGTVDLINSGIRGVDWVVSKFGGPNRAIQPIAKLATGTGALSGQRRPITKPTMAMLNDGYDSPETGNKELAILPNGNAFMPQQRNWQGILPAGTEVLNATETKLMMAMQGIQHFSNGSWLSSATSSIVHGAENLVGKAIYTVKSGASSAWDWTKGVAETGWNDAIGLYNSIKDKLKLIQKLIADPNGFFVSIFGNVKTAAGALRDIGHDAFNFTKSQASDWWSNLVSMMSSALNDSGANSSLLAAAQRLGHGKKYVWGADGPSAYDCSGLVKAAAHALGIELPHYSGGQYADTEHVSASDAKPGDLVFFGHGGSDHVGIYEGNGMYYSAFSPSAHPNIGTYPVEGSVPGAEVLYGRLRGIQDKTKPPKAAKTGMSALIKAETGGMIGWITKYLAPLLDSANNPSGAGVERWKPLIRQAANIMHVDLTDGGMSAILHRIAQESNGDPTVTNNWDSNAQAGNASVGLLQYTPTTLASWAYNGHDNIKNGMDQLLALFNDSNWLSDISVSGGWGPTGHKRLATGGHLDAGETAVVGEKGYELFKPDTAGTVIPHEKSKKILESTNSNTKKINITLKPTYKISGNIKDSKQAMRENNQEMLDMLVDKINNDAGLNDEGGTVV